MSKTPCTVVISTHNEKKGKELARLIYLYSTYTPDNLRILSLPDIGCHEPIPETGDSFHACAAQKALSPAQKVPYLVIADDSGLEVASLGGAPGLHSARYANLRQGKGMANARDDENIYQLLADLRGKEGEQRRARFVCTLAVAKHNQILGYFTGAVHGLITDQPIGEEGFGYDPIFWLPEHQATFAQLGAPVKDKVSHRSLAIRAMLRHWDEWLK